eukprot:gene15327-18159_t
MTVFNIPGLIEGDQLAIDRNKNEIDKAFVKCPVSIVLFVFGAQGGRIRDEDIVAFKALDKAYNLNRDSLCFLVNDLPTDYLRTNPNYEAQTILVLERLLGITHIRIAFTSRIDTDNTGLREKMRLAIIRVTLHRRSKDIVNRVENLLTDHSRHRIDESPYKDETEQFHCHRADEVPEYLRRDHIHCGYRMDYSLTLAAKSILWPGHNEFWNIHSHLWPSLYFIYLALDTLYWNSEAHHFSPSDTFILGMFLLAGITTYTTSTLWHTFGCHSQPLYHNLLLCDYTGIIFLIGSSFFPPLFYAYRLHPTLMIGYMTTITTLCIGLVALVFIPSLSSYSKLRSNLFVGTAAFGIIPMVHAVQILPLDFAMLFIQRIFIMFLLFAIGFLFYSTGFPECLFPGRFDYFIQSHTIWHLFTFLAPLYHFHTCYLSFMNQPSAAATIIHSIVL